ncbi:MAG: serine hydrolase domain-containing protein [Burkholderiaceae bacterium]
MGRSEFSSGPVADPAELGFSAARLGRIRERLARDVDADGLPGAVWLVARHGRIACFEAIGRRDPKADDAMALDSVFRIYSMTKPIVSLATLMLLERGLLQLGDPVAQFIPAFAETPVAVEQDGRLSLRAPQRPMTVHDLLRHTSGLSYEFLGPGEVRRRYAEVGIGSRRRTNEQFCEELAKIPLLHDPGAFWEYGYSTDVLGRVVEVVCGKTLGAFLADEIFGPLGMVDTGFSVPPPSHGRIAEAFETDPDTAEPVRLLDPRVAPAFESGGGGLMSTALDYARFLQAMQGAGRLGDVRLLGRKTFEWMTADHLGAIPSACELLTPGYGFGLGYSVRLVDGVSDSPGSAGQYTWGGIAGTTFWVDPRESLFAILLTQAPGRRNFYRPLFRNLVYQALEA